MVQELAIARAVVIQSSTSWINWDGFWRLVGPVDNHRCFRETHIEEFHILERTRATRDRIATPPYDLLSLVYDFSERQAKDPRDKLFALLRLLEAESDQAKTIRPVPKYLDKE